MSDKTAIEWTDATWNPVCGCSRVSPGCENCYAERVAARFSGPGQPYKGLARIHRKTIPERLKDHGLEPAAQPRWTGTVRIVPEHLAEPLRWRRPRRVFVNSMSDLFHERLSNEAIAAIFGVMAAAPQHTFQVLTKRADRMRDWFAWVAERAEDDGGAWTTLLRETVSAVDPPLGDQLQEDGIARYEAAEPWPLPNAWLGVSIEDQRRADERIPLLVETTAAVRFLSCEPLLGPVDLSRWVCRRETMRSLIDGGTYEVFPGISWVIVGGESGPGARPMRSDWARSLRDQCVGAGVAFFFKQWGEWGDAGIGSIRVGKKSAGRVLDGRTWDGFPAR